MSENFKECILKLDNYATYYRKDKRYLLLFTYDSQQVPTLLVRVYNGDVIWIHQIQMEQLEKIRTKSDIKEGSLSSFIEMLKQSLDSNQYQIIVEDFCLTIVFEFKLTQGVFIKVNFDLGGGLIIQDEDSRRVSSNFTFDLYESMKSKYHELKNHKEKEVKLEQNVEQKIIHEEIKEEKPKRIIHGDIVMPNKKKRKGLGARLG